MTGKEQPKAPDALHDKSQSVSPDREAAQGAPSAAGGMPWGCRAAEPGARERPGPRWRQEGGARCRRGSGASRGGVWGGGRGGCAKDDSEAGEASCLNGRGPLTPGTHRIRGQGSLKSDPSIMELLAEEREQAPSCVCHWPPLSQVASWTRHFPLQAGGLEKHTPTGALASLHQVFDISPACP